MVMRATRWLALGSLSVAVAAGAEDAPLTAGGMASALQQRVSAFVPVELPSTGVVAEFRATLGDDAAVAGPNVFDGLRFRAPPAARSDFVWYFNAPAAWGQWYIVPATGAPMPAFKRWFNADQVYERFDIAGETGRLRVAQTLAGGYFEPGREYLLWFKRDSAGGDGTLRGAMVFARSRADWKLADVEHVLGLKPQGLAEQAAAMDSRGARILLDRDFFDPDYAAERIRSVFFSRRNTSGLGGGSFVTIETAVPPCRTEPSWSAIERRYGPADLVITADEERRVRELAGEVEEGEDEPEVDRHFCDYFVFEVGARDPSQRVVRVATGAANAARLRPPDAGGHFARWSRPALMVFHRGGLEAGRIYGFLEAGEPQVVREPEPGAYRGDGEELVYRGEGRWTWIVFHPGGAVALTVELERHRLHGVAEQRDAGGRVTMRATYRGGQLDGDVVQYAPDGSEASRATYRAGRPVSRGAR